MKFLGNAIVFVILYILFMLPTYYLPYLGSNSAVLNTAGEATNNGLSPALGLHVGSLIILIAIAWFRGSFIDKKWLIIFPILATIFDLGPGLSAIPFVPTVMHLFAIIQGVSGGKAITKSTE